MSKTSLPPLQHPPSATIQNSMAAKPKRIDDWIKRALKEDPPRSKSLLITIFGDSVQPYATGIWLSELIALLKPFHVNERLVRTSGFRLAEEGWLQSTREGRRSRYALTPSGAQRVDHAAHRIYAPAPASWDGSWTFVVQSKASALAADRAELRRELHWEGFGTLGSGLFLHPCADLTALAEVLDRFQPAEKVTVLQARDLGAISSQPAARLAAECWNLDSLAAEYRQFLHRFEPALSLLQHGAEPATAFLAQTLLIHAFRRRTLHDPRLPAVLLPPDWPGTRAFELCREIYRLTFEPTCQHLSLHLQAPGSEATPPGLTASSDLLARFGGLKS